MNCYYDGPTHGDGNKKATSGCQWLGIYHSLTARGFPRALHTPKSLHLMFWN